MGREQSKTINNRVGFQDYLDQNPESRLLSIRFRYQSVSHSLEIQSGAVVSVLVLVLQSGERLLESGVALVFNPFLLTAS